MLASGRSFLLLAFGLTLGCACNRTEEPASPVATDAGGSNAGANSAAGTSSGGASSPLPSQSSAGGGATAAPACLVPFGEPAPIASKAVECPKDPTGNLTLPKGRVTFVDAPNSPSAEIELARDEASRERGLMYRTSMPEGSGMLFSWQDERVRNFWMHNTCIPLDMLYITKDGVVAGILEQVPTLNDAPRGIKCPVAHVLELNAGWARSHGIAPGMKVKIEG
jgi:uncharacterized membrane protein (UPF0127 family)